jgi:serine/threonine-protein kinase
VDSEHVVSLLAHGDHKGRPYMVFALVDGEDLRERLRRDGPLLPVEATRVALAMAAGLEDAHAQRVVHRDLKPANVLLDDEGAVQLADFGIARMLEEPGLTQPGRVLGTGEYVSPEQALGRQVDGRSDIYALGVVLFEMLTGRPPYTGPGFADVAAQHVRAPVPLVAEIAPDTPASLASLVTRCLQKRPEERPANARVVRRELDAILASLEDEEYETGEHDSLQEPQLAASAWHMAPDPVDDPWDGRLERDPDPWAVPVPPLPPVPRSPEQAYAYDDGRGPRRDSGITRWLAIMALGAALLVGAFIWNSTTGGSSGGDSAGAAGSTTAPGTSAAAASRAADASTATAAAVPDARRLRILGASSFDPDGDGSEREDLAPLAVDGKIDTAWESENYRDTPELTRIKPGLGLEVELARPAEIQSVFVRSERLGYTVAIYTSALASSPTGLAEWTPVVDAREVTTPTVRLELDRPLRARHVLLWFTALSPTLVNNRYGVSVTEVQVLGLPAGAVNAPSGTDGTGTDATATDTAAGDATGGTSPDGGSSTG